MKELGTDELGRRIVEHEGMLKFIVPTGQSVSFTRKFLADLVAKNRAEADKFQRYLDMLDAATEPESASDGGGREGE